MKQVEGRQDGKGVGWMIGGKGRGTDVYILKAFRENGVNLAFLPLPPKKVIVNDAFA